MEGHAAARLRFPAALRSGAPRDAAVGAPVLYRSVEASARSSPSAPGPAAPGYPQVPPCQPTGRGRPRGARPDSLPRGSGVCHIPCTRPRRVGARDRRRAPSHKILFSCLWFGVFERTTVVDFAISASFRGLHPFYPRSTLRPDSFWFRRGTGAVHSRRGASTVSAQTGRGLGANGTADVLGDAGRPPPRPPRRPLLPHSPAASRRGPVPPSPRRPRPGAAGPAESSPGPSRRTRARRTDARGPPRPGPRLPVTKGPGRRARRVGREPSVDVSPRRPWSGEGAGRGRAAARAAALQANARLPSPARPAGPAPAPRARPPRPSLPAPPRPTPERNGAGRRRGGRA